MAASQAGNFNIQEFSDAGLLLVGGRVYTYVYGTTTQKAAYTDAAGVVPHTYTSDGIGGQYIALNARGELPAPLYLTTGAYDIALKRADGSTVWTRRADPTSDNSSTLDAAIRSDLADATNAAKGSALVGFDATLSYAYGTTGHALRNRAISVTDKPWNALADFGATTAATNNPRIQSALNSFGANGGTLTIPKGVKWGPYASVTHPDEVTIYDLSGWDFINSAWTGKQKIITKTASPGTKNANEFHVVAPYHPAVAVDTYSDGTVEQRCSYLFRRSGATDYQFVATKGTGADRILSYSFYGHIAGVDYTAGTNIWGFNPDTGVWAWGGLPQAGVDYTWYGLGSRVQIDQYNNSGALGFERQFKNATNGLVLREQVDGTGVLSYQTGLAGLQYGFLSTAGEMYGYRSKVVTKASNYTMNVVDTSTTNTNSAAGTITYSLVPAVPGLRERFVVTNGPITVAPATGEKFRGKVANATYTSSTLGSIFDIECVVSGVWEEIITKAGFA